jgi:hypothetical protein
MKHPLAVTVAKTDSPKGPPKLVDMNARTVRLEAERAAAFADLKSKLEVANGNVTVAATLFNPPITRDRAQHLTRRLGLVAYAAELRLKAGVGHRVQEGSMRGKVMGRPWVRNGLTRNKG